QGRGPYVSARRRRTSSRWARGPGRGSTRAAQGRCARRARGCGGWRDRLTRTTPPGERPRRASMTTRGGASVSPTRLERALADGRFAVTGELGPPKHAGAEAVRAKARLLGPVCEAVNITDNQTAQSRMSPLA